MSRGRWVPLPALLRDCMLPALYQPYPSLSYTSLSLLSQHRNSYSHSLLPCPSPSPLSHRTASCRIPQNRNIYRTPLIPDSIKINPSIQVTTIGTPIYKLSPDSPLPNKLT
jgi:hypothetical protein